MIALICDVENKLIYPERKQTVVSTDRERRTQAVIA